MKFYGGINFTSHVKTAKDSKLEFVIYLHSYLSVRVSVVENCLEAECRLKDIFYSPTELIFEKYILSFYEFKSQSETCRMSCLASSIKH